MAWCGDVTYIPTDEGWLYLASVIDLAVGFMNQAPFSKAPFSKAPHESVVPLLIGRMRFLERRRT